MSDCVLIRTWATMDTYELSSIGRKTLLFGIQEAAAELERLRAIVDRLPKDAEGNAVYSSGACCPLRLAEKDRADRLQAIVDRLPSTADGVAIVPGMTIYQIDGSPAIVSGYDWHGDWWEIELQHDGFLPSDEVYSTCEAVEKEKAHRVSKCR